MSNPAHFDGDSIPEELQSRDQMLHWDASHQTPRRPHKAGDFSVAWSDPDEWLGFDEAVEQANENESWGIGYVTAAENPDCPMGVVSVIDIDGGLDESGEPKNWLPELDPLLEYYAEKSPSAAEEGDTGIHVPVVGTNPPEWWTDSHIDGHEGIDVLANKFCTVTGRQLAGAGDELARWSDEQVVEWLADAYEALTGEQPRREPPEPEPRATGAESYDDDWPDVEAAETMLEHVDPDASYEQWRNVGFALASHFSEHQAKRLFDRWSRRGSKYDDDATRLIDDISARGDGGVTIGTLIHLAEQGGWEPDRGTEPPTPRELVARNSDEFASAADVPDDFFGDASAPDGGAVAADDGGDSDAIGPNPAGGDWDTIYEQYAGAADADERLVPRHEAAKQLDAEAHWRCVLESDTLYRYDRETGIYRDNGEGRLRETLSHELREQFKAHEASEISEQIRGWNTVLEEKMGGPDRFIATAECVIEIDGDDIRQHEHSPEYNFLSRLKTEYDPDADCPRFREFLDESVPEASARKTLQEFAGYLLMHWDLPYHKSLFLVGPTASGKSTFLDTLRSLLGQDSTCSLTPQQMTEERFGGSELYGTWANIRNDIPTATVENTGQFKEIVAGDPIKAEEKYEQPFMFQPTAKHAFSANQLPDPEEDDEAFFRRILLISFPHTVPRDERDPALDEKLQAELPGVLNWALDGLLRLQRQRQFTRDRDPPETQETWQKWGNTAQRFEKLCLSKGDETVAKSELYQIYREFCDDEQIPCESQHKLTRLLKTEGYEEGREYIDGSRVRVFYNVGYTSRGADLRDSVLSDESGDQGQSRF